MLVLGGVGCIGRVKKWKRMRFRMGASGKIGWELDGVRKDGDDGRCLDCETEIAEVD